MKSLLIFSLLLIFFSSCQSTADISKEYIENPCRDQEYLRLKKMKFSEMTGAESEYFKKIEKECNDFTNEVDHSKTDSDLLTALVIAGIIGAAIVTLLSIKMH